MTFAVALVIGASFWGQRDITIPCHPQPVAKAEQEMPMVDGLAAEMATDQARCEIWLSPAALEFQRTEPAYFCGEVAHELGHLASLGHSAGEGDGLMDPQHALGTTDWIPWECRASVRATQARRPARRSAACRGKHRAARKACRRRS